VDAPRQSAVVALIQCCATTDVAANLATCERLIREAADRGAATVLLPEAYAFIGPDRLKREIVEEIGPTGETPSPIFERMAELAAELGVHLILGGHHERGPDESEDAKSYNSCVHVGPDGGIRATYRKIHLFDVDLADGTRLHESARTAAGDRVVVTDTPFGRLGLTICYDVRFPYLYQMLADAGATAISVPSAFTATTGAAHWHTLLRARAIESQCYVLAPAQHGRHNEKRRSYGHSLVVDPWGEIVAELPDGDGVLLAEIDPARVEDVREQLPSLRHRVDPAGLKLASREERGQ
jgi:predicted amidohydrolase